MKTPEESIAIKEVADEQLHTLLRKRWSARSFSTEPIAEDILAVLFKAASWAPSAMNEQPWNYIYATKEDKEGFAKLFDLLAVGNQLWVKNAAVIVLCYTNTVYQKSGEVNNNAFHDAGLANENLVLQAVSMNIYGHMMEVFNKTAAKSVFSLKETQQPVCMIALGHLAAAEALEEPFLGRELAPRVRK